MLPGLVLLPLLPPENGQRLGAVPVSSLPSLPIGASRPRAARPHSRLDDPIGLPSHSRLSPPTSSSPAARPEIPRAKAYLKRPRSCSPTLNFFPSASTTTHKPPPLDPILLFPCWNSIEKEDGSIHRPPSLISLDFFLGKEARGIFFPPFVSGRKVERRLPLCAVKGRQSGL